MTRDLASLDGALALLATLGEPVGWVLAALAIVLAACSLVSSLRPYRDPVLWALTGLLVAGEGLLMWFHWRVWAATELIDPLSGARTGRIAAPLWVESEKLYVWALILAIMFALARRHRDEIAPWIGPLLAALVIGGVFWYEPFTRPLPDLIAQYRTYATAMITGDANTAVGLFQSLEGSRRFYYNTWYMWVHPPLLFLSYGAFTMSFAALTAMIARRRQSFEETAYRWARWGYLPLTAGMLLGFPWAIMAWGGEAWWWSGKVNMSIMMWLLYTAYLHGRLYLRRRGMWKVVAALGVLSFVALVLTYVATYVVPGAHSVA